MDLWTYLINKGYSKEMTYYICDKYKNGFNEDDILFKRYYWQDINLWKLENPKSDIGI